MNTEHALQVAKLAILVFEKTKFILHNFDENEKNLLEAGALLHDIGYAISEKKHHKNAYKIITREGIDGYSHEETEIIANIARYHRGKLPLDGHENFAKLDECSKDLVKKLGGMVKLADALDRSHLSPVNNIDFSYDAFSKILQMEIKNADSDISSEMGVFYKKKDLMQEGFNINIVLIDYLQ
jgi:exopolyphosphatase/guanosine-5'-triphosphate,3'-diphosphate pyrophosphatase